MPIWIFFFGLTFVRTVRDHWPAPGFVPVLMLSAAVVLRGGARGVFLHKATIAVLAVGYTLGVGVLAVMNIPHSWARLAEEGQFVADIPYLQQSLPDPGMQRRYFVLASDYHHAAQLGYYLPNLEACDFSAIGIPGKSFRNWWKPEAHVGESAVIVFAPKDYPGDLPRLKQCFDHVGKPVEVAFERFPWKHDKFLLVLATGYHPYTGP